MFIGQASGWVPAMPGRWLHILKEIHMLDLYVVDLSGLKSVKLRGGNTDTPTDEGSEDESYAVMTAIPGLSGAVEISDSKNPDLKGLRFTRGEMENLINGYIANFGMRY